jgi:predicted MFS family arabinose efflux permease
MLRKISLVYMTFFVFAAGMGGFFALFSDKNNSYGHDGNVAASTEGIAMMIFGLVLIHVGLRQGHLWAWRTLWVMPLFFTGEFLGYYAFSNTRGSGAWAPAVFAILFAAALFAVKPKPDSA